MKIGFDIVSDLNLETDIGFNWQDKATSLYCLVAGNISSNIDVVGKVLSKLGDQYQGVFYIPGSLEYVDSEINPDIRTTELLKRCEKIKNVVFLYQHVVIIDGIAIVAGNGWFGNTDILNPDYLNKVLTLQYGDLYYLKTSIDKLQRHLDVTKIIVMTNSVPKIDLFFGEVPKFIDDSQIQPDVVLAADTMKKVSHWIFGSHEKIVDTVVDSINYVNNPCFKRNPYWAKRIEL